MKDSGLRTTGLGSRVQLMFRVQGLVMSSAASYGRWLGKWEWRKSKTLNPKA